MGYNSFFYIFFQTDTLLLAPIIKWFINGGYKVLLYAEEDRDSLFDTIYNVLSNFICFMVMQITLHKALLWNVICS